MWKGGGVVQPPSTDAKKTFDAELASLHSGIADHHGRLRASKREIDALKQKLDCANIDCGANFGCSMMEEKVEQRKG